MFKQFLKAMGSSFPEDDKVNKVLSNFQNYALKYKDNPLQFFKSEIDKAGEIAISNAANPVKSNIHSFLTTKFDDGFWPHIEINPFFKTDNSPARKSRDYELIRPVINFVNRREPVAADNRSAEYVNTVLGEQNFNKIRNEHIHPVFASLNDKALRMLIRYIINQETLVKLMSLDVKCLKEFAPKLTALRKEIAEMASLKDKLIELKTISEDLKRCKLDQEELIEESKQEVKKSKDLQDKVNELEDKIKLLELEMQDLTEYNEKLRAANSRTTDIKAEKINAITEEKEALEREKKDLLDSKNQLISLSTEVNLELERSKEISARLR
jgi:hypothetical protein